ncbi:MAG: CoA transferase, partial [Alphaproteobacteria bacterium]
RVIKIERPEGDFGRHYDHLVLGQSSYFVWLNRGKESMCLNLKDDDDRALLANILSKADIFIQNLAPGRIAQLGFSQTELRKKYPRLITCAFVGFGSEGPMQDNKAYDLLVQGETGLSSITGNEWGPTRVGVSVSDISAGMTAAQSIFQALYMRERTGVGRHIEVSLFHAMMDWMNVPYLQYVYGEKAPQRIGLHHPTIAPYGSYACAGGQSMIIAIQNEREWRIFCHDVLERPELATDPRFKDNDARVAYRDALDAELVPFFLELEREEAMALLKSFRIASGRVNSIEDVSVHPHNVFHTVETPNGPIEMLVPGIATDGERPELGPVPSPDEHGPAIRREFDPKKVQT